MQLNRFLVFFGCILFGSCAKEIVKPFGPGNIILVRPDVTVGITRIEWQYNNQDYPTRQLGIYTVIPNRNPDNNEVAGCTGLGYNPLTRQFVVAFYNGASASKIWLFNRGELTPYNTVSSIIPVPSAQIDVSAYIDYIEGIDYDTDLRVYWAIGTKKGADKNDNNRVLISVDESGALRETYDLSAYSFNPGMLVNVGNYLLIKPDNYYWLLVLDKVSKKNIGQIPNIYKK